MRVEWRKSCPPFFNLDKRGPLETWYIRVRASVGVYSNRVGILVLGTRVFESIKVGRALEFNKIGTKYRNQDAI